MTNTSAKRVLVTRADGSQTVEVVNGGLAATGMDKKGILRSLRSRVRFVCIRVSYVNRFDSCLHTLD